MAVLLQIFFKTLFLSKNFLLLSIFILHLQKKQIFIAISYSFQKIVIPIYQTYLILMLCQILLIWGNFIENRSKMAIFNVCFIICPFLHVLAILHFYHTVAAQISVLQFDWVQFHYLQYNSAQVQKGFDKYSTLRVFQGYLKIFSSKYCSQFNCLEARYQMSENQDWSQQLKSLVIWFKSREQPYCRVSFCVKQFIYSCVMVNYFFQRQRQVLNFQRQEACFCDFSHSSSLIFGEVYRATAHPSIRILSFYLLLSQQTLPKFEKSPILKRTCWGCISCDNKYNMSKHKFISTNREKFSHQKTQQFASQEVRKDHKSVEKPRDLLLPIEQPKKYAWGSKVVRSEGKSSQRETKMPTFQLINFKDSLLLRKSKDSFNLKSITRKRTNTNRINTQKVPKAPTYSVDKHSVNKILIRGGGYSKEVSPQRNNYFRPQNERIWISEKLAETQPALPKESPRRIMQKKLTPFEREEAKQYEIYYAGPRRVHSLQDFTDSQGDAKVSVGDAIAYKYEIVAVLGRGSFGKVFKAYDHKKKEHIALKIIKNQQKFTVQARVEIEILETAILHDPKLRNNIVRLKGSFIFRGHTCLKFEILSKNLYEFIKQTNFAGFSLDLIRRFAIQILQALHFFQKFGIIHCDLKPQNILLKEENKSGIKVIDVGSGCFDGKQIYTYIQSRFYRAPEIILGVKYSAAIDVWSFGCILVELYTGIPLFPGQNQNEQMLMFIELLGIPPLSLLQRAQRRKKFFTEDGTPRIPPIKNKQKIREAMNWKAVLGSDCDRKFLNLVQRCLQWDPIMRITPKEALLHEWIVAGLPHTIRAQHVQQLTSHE